MTLTAAALLAAACAVVGGCQPAAPRAELDLVADTEHAVVRYAWGSFHFSDPRNRAAMTSGWHIDASALSEGSDIQGVWAVGDRSSFEVFIPEPKDRTLNLMARHTVLAEPTIRVSIDGHVLGEVELVTGLAHYELDLPASVQHGGVHRIEIDQPTANVRRQPHKDYRTFWHSLAISDMPASARAPDADPEQGKLILSPGTRVDYYVELPTEASFAADEVITRSGARLQVSWHPLTGEASEVGTFGRKAGVDRPIAGSGPGRLSFEVLGPDGSAVTLLRPRLLGPEDWQHPSVSPLAEMAADPATASAATPTLDPAERPPIFLYMIDTLRADHLGVYGYDRPTSPNIDAFAQDAVVFENALAQTSWTRASIATALTGLLPPSHGAIDETDVLPESVETLAESLSAAGYRTGAVVANGNASNQLGFGQGFDDFAYLIRTQDGFLARSGTVHERALEWLDDQETGAPVFLWTLTIDPHAPYAAPEPFHSRFSDRPFDPEAGAVLRLASLATQEEAIPPEEIDHLRDLYDAEVAHNDARFAEFLDALRERDLYDRSVIILLADHGEEFYDHGGFEHGRGLYIEQLRTPLIVKLPGSTATGRRSELVQQADLMPTILELVGLPIQPSHGRSLVPILSDQPADRSWDRVLLKHLDLRNHNYLAATDGQHRVILPRRFGWDHFPRLFNLVDDPDEQHNLALEQPELARFLTAQMQRRLAAVDSIEREQVDMDEFERTKEQLQALGYLN